MRVSSASLNEDSDSERQLWTFFLFYIIKNKFKYKLKLVHICNSLHKHGVTTKASSTFHLFYLVPTALMTVITAEQDN